MKWHICKTKYAQPLISGVTGILRRHNPIMTNVHCAAHKLALCSSQAAQDIPALKEHQEVLTSLFYYFKNSSKRASRVKVCHVVLLFVYIIPQPLQSYLFVVVGEDCQIVQIAVHRFKG